MKVSDLSGGEKGIANTKGGRHGEGFEGRRRQISGWTCRDRIDVGSKDVQKSR